MNEFTDSMNLQISALKKAGARIGKNVFIGHQVFFELENAFLLTIDDEVVISAFCKFILHDSSLNNVIEAPIRYAPIHLQKNCYIGADCLILPGTEVGESTIIGAGSLVKGLINKNSVYFGRPAKYYCSVLKLKKEWKNKKINNIFYIATKKWFKRSNSDNNLLEKNKKNILKFTKYK